MTTRPLTVCIATGTRADWGLLQPVAEELRRRGRVEVKLLVTNMHLLDRYGNTLDEIRRAGFDTGIRVPMFEPGTECEPADALSRTVAMGRCLAGAAEALEVMRPDALVVLGDRYEMLAVASAAAMLRIPLVHLCGGEITEGAIDDKLRHAITKLADLHLTATDEYSRRVIRMGEQPDAVITIGAPGVWNLMHQPLMSRTELSADTGLPERGAFAVVTLHPATMSDEDPARVCRNMFAALDRFPGMHLLVTYPNNDAGSHLIINAIEEAGRERPGRITLVPSLGMRRYLSAITHADVVIGNSSSGIIEVPSAGTPVVNIGSRQQGRLHSPLVIDCGESTDEIASAIALALDADFVRRNAAAPNPYARDNTPVLAAEAIERLAARGSRRKHFYEPDLKN